MFPKSGASSIQLFSYKIYEELGAVVIGLGITVWLYPPLFPWGLAQLDRSPFCPRDEAYRASQRRYDLVKTIGKVQGGFTYLRRIRKAMNSGRLAPASSGSPKGRWVRCMAGPHSAFERAT